jgi:hypothetical protein
MVAPKTEFGASEAAEAKLAAGDTPKNGGHAQVSPVQAGRIRPGRGSGGVAEFIVDKTLLTSHGRTTAIFPHVYTDDKSSDSFHFACLFTTADDAVSVFIDNEIKWTREEALAAVRQSQWHELVHESAFGGGAATATDYPSFVARLAPEAKMLVASVTGGVTSIAAQITDMMKGEATTGKGATAAAGGDAVLTTGTFGLRKMIVSLTQSGKLYGVVSDTGVIAWSTFLFNVVGESTVEGAAKLHSTGTHTAAVVVASVNGKASIVHVNTLTGAVTSKETLKAKPLLSMLLSQPADAQGETPIVVVDQNFGVSVHPKTPSSTARLAAVAASMFFHVTDTDAGVITGYRLVVAKANGKGKGESKKMSTQATWTLAFPKGIETISATSSPSPHEHVSSPTIARTPLEKGQPSTMYKYLNPNMLVVVTERVAPAADANSGGDGSGGVHTDVVPSLKKTSDPSVSVYVVDTVTGSVLHRWVQSRSQLSIITCLALATKYSLFIPSFLSYRVAHKQSVGPVHVTQTENTIVYHYFNAKSNQYQLSVIDLYEDRHESMDASFDKPHFDSRSSPPPISEEETFIFRSPIRSLSATSTRRGIAVKNILIGLASGSVMEVPRQMLSAYRIVLPEGGKLSKEQHKAGLTPYVAEIPVSPLSFLSYNRTIANIASISTSDANLESPSLVFATGLDQFYTATSPSQTFDLLNEDFNFAFLVLTVVGVYVGIVITRRSASKKALAEAWK